MQHRRDQERRAGRSPVHHPRGCGAPSSARPRDLGNRPRSYSLDRSRAGFPVPRKWRSRAGSLPMASGHQRRNGSDPRIHEVTHWTASEHRKLANVSEEKRSNDSREKLTAAASESRTSAERANLAKGGRRAGGNRSARQRPHQGSGMGCSSRETARVRVDPARLAPGVRERRNGAS